MKFCSEFLHRRFHHHRRIVGAAVLATLCIACGRQAEDRPPPTQSDLTEAAERCRTMLQTSIVDFYYPHALDTEYGGFKELHHDGAFVHRGERFVLMQARQLWSFSHFALAGLQKEESLAAAKSGFDYLQRHLLDRAHGGYYAKVTDAGEPIDKRKHVYQQSFVVYALAAYHRASQDHAALEAARELFLILEEKAYDPRHGGYNEFFYDDWTPITDPEEPTYIAPPGQKSFNAHLHLMEGFAELYRVWPDDLLRQRIAELIAVNTHAVQYPRVNQNIDFWYDDWTLIPDPANQRTSYGHDIEGVWLTLDAADAIALPRSVLRGWAESLTDSVLAKGWDRRHGGIFATGPLGQPADELRKTWWAQAEALLGFAYLFEFTENAIYFDYFLRTLDFIEDHLIAPQGGWWSEVDPDGTPAHDAILSSEWQGAYHSGRALLFSAEILERMAR